MKEVASLCRRLGKMKRLGVLGDSGRVAVVEAPK